jgi:hypothetical protein
MSPKTVWKAWSPACGAAGSGEPPRSGSSGRWSGLWECALGGDCETCLFLTPSLLTRRWAVLCCYWPKATGRWAKVKTPLVSWFYQVFVTRTENWLAQRYTQKSRKPEPKQMSSRRKADTLLIACPQNGTLTSNKKAWSADNVHAPWIDSNPKTAWRTEAAK